ncbi:T9SS type A sorting domain-containing protein [Arcticibacterium luteifluviistationis]|uniref:Secretion system C-terminal sorting domain-containing protein n=1 Tax=Arcticibacterium luteifluviistationis TaxID=1784714 RepID=A0A2Z4GA78_9BACT|nr:T9SS type A sorting domain-containing protein [Arcticibacterium luteifluviistationis]AWV98159.1 hypothetical protein DJ013_08225 [Arcticibacterium luteifluviistationis]
MRNAVFFLLIVHSAFSQVFEQDMSFEFPGLSKMVTSPRVSAINLPNGKVIFSHVGTHINDSLQVATLLWNANRGKIEPFSFFEDNFNEPLYRSQLSNTGEFLFYKSYSYTDNGVAESTLSKIDFNGNEIEGFDFKEEGFLFKVMELADGKILARFGDGSYRIYSESGDFENGFSLKASGLGDNVTLNDVVFLDGFYYFLLVQNDSGKVSVKRTDTFLANPKNISLPQLDNVSAPQNKLFNIGEMVYLYTSSLNDENNHLFEFDREGNEIRDVEFGKVGNYMSSLPEVFWSDAGDIAFKYHENDWIKINTNSTYEVYHKETGIINFQKNGLFQIREDLEVFEVDFKLGIKEEIALKFTQQLDFKPTKVFASENGIRLVEYRQNAQSALSTYWSTRPNLVRLFDDGGELIKELFDNESVLESSAQGDFVLVKGREKIYILDSTNVLLEYENKCPGDAQFDLEHQSVFYTNLIQEANSYSHELVKTDLNGLRNEDFKYKSSSIQFQILPNSYEIALFTSTSGTNVNIEFLNMRDGGTTRTHFLESDHFEAKGTNELIPTENGMYLRKIWVGGTGGYSYSLGKITKEGNLDTNFKQSNVLGGQFYSVKKDGSIVFNSLGLKQNDGITYSKSLKLFANGDVDRDFAILSKESIIHFSEQNDDTLFVTSASGLHRFIKNDDKSAPYLYVETDMKSDVSWEDVKPTYFKVHVSDSTYTIDLSENLRLENDTLCAEAKPGAASIFINSERDGLSYLKQIRIHAVKPHFIYDVPELHAFQGPTWLKFSSSSGEPVYIKDGENKPESRDSILVSPNKSSNRIGLYLRVDRTDYYTSVEEYLLLFVSDPLGIDEELIEVLAYPNPSKGAFRIPLTSEDVSEMELVNMLGKRVSFTYQKDDRELKLNVPHYTPGVHILTLREHNQKHVFRLVLE